MAKTEVDDRITKRRVTMRAWVLAPAENEGDPPRVEKHEAIDYVLPEVLDAYVADAKTRWPEVTVSDEPDAGPGGYEGNTAALPHLQAGVNLQDHLHEAGVKDIQDPTNTTAVAISDLGA